MSTEKPHVALKPSTTVQLAFVETVLKIHDQRGLSSRQDGIAVATNEAEALFIRAGLEFPSFETKKEPPYENKGFPPRNSWILMPQKWDQKAGNGRGGWVDCPISEGTRRALATSRAPIEGKLKDRHSRERLQCFNARPMYSPDSTSPQYSFQRFYLCDEGTTWRWA